MFVYRDLKWKELPGLVHRTLKTVAMMMTLIACASSFGYVMALMQIPEKITAFFLTLSHNKDAFTPPLPLCVRLFA
jgi:TRAP-type C4-dicarboxylate transport system permease large subunit